MSAINLLVIDTETGGVNKNKDGICQMTAVLFDPADGYHQIMMNAYCKPRAPLSPESTAIHGITNEQVAYQPDDDVQATLLKILIEGLMKEMAGDGTQLVLSGYNSQTFDMPFLDNVLGEGFFTRFDHIDVMRLVKSHYPTMKNHKLVTAYQTLIGKPAEGAHDAVFDCLMTVEILKFLQEEKGLDYAKLAGVMAEPTVLDVMPQGKHQGKSFKDLPGEYLQFCYDNFDVDSDVWVSCKAELVRRGRKLKPR